jgi:hypothetical protein
MKVRIKKVPKLNRYQALLTEGQVEDPFYIPNTDQGQRNYVNAPVNLNQKAPGVGTVLQPGLMPDVNNKMVNLNNVNDNLTNENPLNKGKGLVGSITEKGKSKFGNWLEGQKGIAAYQNRQNIKDFVTNIASYERKADADQRAVNAFHMGQPIAASTQGTFDVNSMNNFTPGMLNTVPSTGDFSAAPYMSMGYGRDGGQYMAYGGRVFNQIAPNALPDDTSKPLVSVQKTLQPIPRDQANIEAEKDETIYFLNNGGLPAHYKIGGQPHSKGGTPLNVPEDSFVYSKALKLKNKNLFEYFNISNPTSFADIAKKYDINKYRKVLADPDTDKLQRETAEKMIGNYNLKLGMLALAQESTKGFPQGLPEVGVPFTVVNAVDPQMILPTPPPQLAERAQQQPQEEMMEEPMMEQPVAKYGGNLGGRMRVRIKSLPAYQSVTTSGQVSSVDDLARLIADAMGDETVNSDVNTQGTSTSTPAPQAASNQRTAQSAPASNNNKPAAASSSTAKKSKTPSVSAPTPKERIGTIEANQDYWNEYSEGAKQGLYIPELPMNISAEEDREKHQGIRKGTKNIYGDKDWHKGAEWDDFKKRHKWYLDTHPDFDPENKSDVEDFQRSYCEKAKSFGLKTCYFKEKGSVGTGFDGLFGEHTWNAAGFNKPESTPTKTGDEKDSRTQPDIETNPLDVPQNLRPNKLKFYPQDMWNLAAAMGQRLTVPDTWYAPLQFKGVDSAYLVPDYSPIMEAANIATQGVNAYGSRQSADASLSRIQGQSARPAAEHNLAVANANAGIYNNASQINAQIANQNAMYNNTLAQADFDARQLYEQDLQKAKNKKWSDVTNLAGNMLTNAVNTYNLNQLYPHYQIDPGTGGTAFFDRGEQIKANKNAMQSDIKALYSELVDLGYDRDEILEILKSSVGSKYRNPQNELLPEYGTGMMPGVNPYTYG